MAAPSTATKTKTVAVQTGAGDESAGVEGYGDGTIPFIRGSNRLRTVNFFDQSGITLLANTQDFTANVKAFDYMRAIIIRVDATAAGGGSGVTTTEDGPFDMFTNVEVLQPNGQTLFKVSSGVGVAFIDKYGGYRANADPRDYPQFVYTTGSGTAPTASYYLRIPFEMNLRTALGALPNKDAAAPFVLNFSLNTLANVWGGAPTTPTFRIRAFLETWEQPPEEMDGQPVATTPPNLNTIQRWTEKKIAVNAGQFDAQLKAMGNYLRMIIPVLRRNASTRANGDADWPDPLQIVLDEDVRDNIQKTVWQDDIYEKWGYGSATYGTPDTARGRDNGVYPYEWCSEFDGRVGMELGDLYLPTIESEEFLLRGSWGNAGTITVYVCEILPQGDIWS